MPLYEVGSSVEGRGGRLCGRHGEGRLREYEREDLLPSRPVSMAAYKQDVRIQDRCLHSGETRGRCG